MRRFRLPFLAVLTAAAIAAFPLAAQEKKARPAQPRSEPIPEGVEVIRDVEFGLGGGRPLRLHIVRPQALPAGRMPVVVWVHGGAWLAGSRDSGIRPLAALARKGYLGASVEYRFSQEARFPAQIEDVKCAIRFLRARASEYRIDPERIGVWGPSSGGHLAALLGTSGGIEELEGKGGWPEQSSRVACVVDFFGPTDLLQMGKGPSIDHDRADSPESRLIGGPIQENREKAARANPIAYITPDDPPFLILHGSQDPLVPPSQSELLNKALKKAGVESELKIIEGAGHGFGGREIDEKVHAFLDRHLKASPKQRSAAF